MTYGQIAQAFSRVEQAGIPLLPRIRISTCGGCRVPKLNFLPGGQIVSLKCLRPGEFFGSLGFVMTRARGYPHNLLAKDKHTRWDLKVARELANTVSGEVALPS